MTEIGTGLGKAVLCSVVQLDTCDSKQIAGSAVVEAEPNNDGEIQDVKQQTNLGNADLTIKDATIANTTIMVGSINSINQQNAKPVEKDEYKTEINDEQKNDSGIMQLNSNDGMLSLLHNKIHIGIYDSYKRPEINDELVARIKSQ